MHIISALIAAAAIAATAPAFAGIDEPAQAVVKYADLDLGSAQGQQTLERRLKAAAHQVCDMESGTIVPSIRVEQRRCFNETLARSHVQMAERQGNLYAAK